MGMFDYVRVEGHKLPGLDPRVLEESQDKNESLAEGPAVFQTKDMENPVLRGQEGARAGGGVGKRVARIQSPLYPRRSRVDKTGRGLEPPSVTSSIK